MHAVVEKEEEVEKRRREDGGGRGVRLTLKKKEKKVRVYSLVSQALVSIICGASEPGNLRWGPGMSFIRRDRMLKESYIKNNHRAS